jgi:transcriptional activator of cad operon
MSQLINSIFCVGDVRVDSALDEIQKDGVSFKLEPRTMRLLVCLAERPGQVVSVDELLDLVWKDVVVSADSVYGAVASLRRTLGDDPKDPTYIATMSRTRLRSSHAGGLLGFPGNCRFSRADSRIITRHSFQVSQVL